MRAMRPKTVRTMPASPEICRIFLIQGRLTLARGLHGAMGEEETQNDQAEKIYDIASVDKAFDHLAEMLDDREIFERASQRESGGFRRPGDDVEKQQDDEASHGGDDLVLGQRR